MKSQIGIWKSLPRTALCMLLLLIACMLRAQSEAESSTNALLFQDQGGHVIGEIEQGEKVRVYPRDGQRKALHGTMDLITDSLVIVGSEGIPIQEIRSISGKPRPMTRQSGHWFLAAAVCVLVSIGLLIALAYAIGSYAVAAAILAGVGFLLVAAFFFVALIMGIVMAIGKSSFYDLKFLTAKVVRYITKF
jgi:hypothetical protein